MHFGGLQTALLAPGVGKLVVFSNNFCDDCTLFEEALQVAARKMKAWDMFLRVYFFDCTREHNVRVCHEFGIRKEPSLVFYPSNYTEKTHGTVLSTRKPIDPQVAAQVAINMKKATNHTLNFQPLTANEGLKALFEKDKTKYVLLVFQKNNTEVGTMTLLGLSHLPAIAVRIVHDEAVMKKYAPGSNVALFDTHLKKVNLKFKKETSEEIVESVAKLISRKERRRTGYRRTHHFLPKMADSTVDYYHEQLEITTHTLNDRSTIFRADLEQALMRILHMEIPKMQAKGGMRLVALRNWVKLLSEVNPLNKKGRTVLKQLHQWMEGQKNPSGEQFLETVYTLENAIGHVFQGRHYVGCVATEPFLRGYPCALWILFHFLTVEAAREPTPFKPGFVIRTIRDFVQYLYYDCPYCSNEFMKISGGMDHVTTHEDEILWLWAAHNKMNHKLAGDGTEDPKFPKVQYPPKELCEECMDQTWNNASVLSFLRSIYDQKSLSFYGLPTILGYE
ncbi:hypothetical protein KR067_002083 [Drosophila pandora]|nr:hypothetical protein KR067_002083 [Drosophila pandora]